MIFFYFTRVKHYMVAKDNILQNKGTLFSCFTIQAVAATIRLLLCIHVLIEHIHTHKHTLLQN